MLKDVREIALGIYDCSACSVTLVRGDDRFFVLSGQRLNDLFPGDDYWHILVEACLSFDEKLVKEVIARIKNSVPYEFELDRVLFIEDGQISNIEKGSHYDL